MKVAAVTILMRFRNDKRPKWHKIHRAGYDKFLLLQFQIKFSALSYANPDELAISRIIRTQLAK